MKAVLLFSAPEGLRLLCADARHRLYVTDAVSGGGEDVTEAFYTGDEAPLCAEFTGDTLLVMYAGGLKTFSYPGLRLLGGAVPATLPALRAVPAGRLVVSVRSRQLATEGLRTATALVAADARAVEADYRAAVATLAAEARAQGVLTQPVLARYVLEDAAGNDVFTSPAVLLGTAQLGGTRTAAVDSGGLMAGYTVEADTWRLHLEVPAGLENAGVRRIRVMVSPQFQTVLPEQSAVDLRLAHPSTGQYVAQVAVGLRPVAEALLPSNADAAARVVADAVARMAALERCVAQTPAGEAAHTLVCGAAGEPAEEYADVAAALRRAVAGTAPADVLTAPPHSFSARCAAVAGRTVMWGNISPRRFRGYPVQLFAATTRDKSWRGYIAVDFADGGRVVWSAAESSGAPDAIGPLLSYPAPDAVAMTVVLAVAGEGVVRGRFDLAPLADGRSSAWLAPGLAPFRLTEEAAEGEDTPPEAVDTGSALPDCVVAADAAAPAWALASARGFGGEIRCMLPAAGGTAAWDFGRERVAVFSSGGLFTAALGSRRDIVAAGRIDGRRVEDASAVVRGTYFHREWLRCVAGRGDKRAVFVPWTEIEIYRLEPEDPAELAATMNEYEKRFWDSGLCLDQIYWYRRTAASYDTREMMMAEFPTTDDEAFMNTGAGVFAPEAVARLRRGCSQEARRGEMTAAGFRPDSLGAFRMWRDVEPRSRYVVAVDIGGRSARADWSVIAVMREARGPADAHEVVAQWRGHTDHDLLVTTAERIARHYNYALLVIESNTLEAEETDGANLFVLSRLAERYSNVYRRQSFDRDTGTMGTRVGFHTNRATKALVISALIEAVRDGLYTERDTGACDELLTYEQRPNGSYAARSGCHDDILMTRALALHALHSAPVAPAALDPLPDRLVW